jgi:uncharacterized RDD family membrane protein YckC
MPYTCEKCGNTTYDQLTQTQVICMKCGNVSIYDTGYRVPKQFDHTSDFNILDLTAPHYTKASLAKRFINYIIDSFVIVMAVILLLDIFAKPPDITPVNAFDPLRPFTQQDLLMFAILAFTFPIYYTLLEYKFGKTLGKLITKTRVVSSDGSPLTFRQCLGRTLCRLIPFERFSGFFMGGLFWHDLFSKTMVADNL